MSIFGWSLPPGCGTLPGEEDEPPCEVCGKFSEDCICPECPVCGCHGDPKCYRPEYGHGLVPTQEQQESLALMEAGWKAQQEAEAEWAKREIEWDKQWREELLTWKDSDL
jgi:hypothetical protein